MTPFDILARGEDELLSYITARIKKANPHINIGETIEGPTAIVWKGKRVDRLRMIPQPVIKLDFTIPHHEDPYVCVQVQTIKVHFDELDCMEWSSFSGKWLYPFKASVPHADWLTQHQPGDTVMVLDDQHDASPYTLTEKDFKDHSYVVFRFAVSD